MPLNKTVTALFLAGTAVSAFTQLADAATPAFYGADAMVRLDRLPYLSSDISTGLQSSFDRSGDNNDMIGLLYTINGEKVMLDLKGPGVVYSIWSTGWNYTNDHIKVYFDGESQPRIDMVAGNFWSGTAAGFPAPFSVNDQVSSGGFICYVPLPFARSIRITNTGGSYYHVGYQKFAPDAQVTSWTPNQDLSAANAIWTKVGSDPKPAIVSTASANTFDLNAGQTETLLDIAGPRAIECLRIKIPELGPAPMSVVDVLNNIALKIYYDNEATPSVDAPIGSFFAFGQFGATVTVRSLMVGIDTSGYLYCYFPMPFAVHCKVTLTSSRGVATTGVSSEIRHAPFTDSFANVGYFKTRFNHEVHTANDGTDILFLDTTGSGKFVGVVLSEYGNPVRNYMEGDERFYVDNNRAPVWQGTGTEDFFQGGWTFRNGPFSLQMHGNPIMTVTATDAKVGMYRFMLHDVIEFRTHVRASIEHGPVITNSIPVESWSLAYFYHKPQPSAVPTDSLDIGTSGSETAHGFIADSPVVSSNLTSVFEGAFETVSITHAVKSCNGTTAFNIAIRPSNNGVVVRRMFDMVDYLAPPQSADVSVDGAAVGTWYNAAMNGPGHRWKEDEFLIPATYTHGKSQLRLSLRCTSGAPAWTQSKYWVFSLTDTIGGATAFERGPASYTPTPLIQTVGTLSVYALDGRLEYRAAPGGALTQAALQRGLKPVLHSGVYAYRIAQPASCGASSNGFVTIR